MAEGLGLAIIGLVVRQAAGDDNAVVFGEEDAVDVVVLGVLRLGSDAGRSFGHAVCAVVGGLDKLASLDEVQLHERRDAQSPNSSRRAAEQIRALVGRRLHNLAVAQHHLDVVDRLVEEAVAERAALAGSACVAAAGRDAGELHHDGRHQAVAQRRLDQAVHGHIGLDERRPRTAIDRQDVAEGADVDGAVAGAGTRPCAVRRAVEDAIRLAALKVAPDGGGNLGHGLLVALHRGSAACVAPN